ncbi:MAG: OmpA family protein [Deltaproteobacteria bacterium]|nr:OmpA family protein [Deltaproteobacteria bacterium]
MKLRRPIALAATSLLTLTALPASAQEQPGYAANHMNPSERGSRWFVLDSLDLAGNGRLALGVVNDYSYRSLVHWRPDDTEASIVRNQVVAHLGASAIFADRFRLGINVPLQLFADGNPAVIGGVLHRPANEVAVGDVRLSGDVRIAGTSNDPATVALGAEVFAPAGSTTAYTGDGEPRVMPRVLFAGKSSDFMYAAKLGVMFRTRDEAFGQGYIGNSLVYGLSGGVLLADGKILLGPELYGSTVLAGGRAFESRTTPLEAIFGAHADLGANLRAGLGLGVGLTRGYGAPVARALLSLEWVPGDAKPEAAAPTADRDGDGIADCDDACSFVPGVKSDDKARNGCPVDSDNDGIPDDADACPHVPGARTADGAYNGCPADFDHDGIPDHEDACPREIGRRSADPHTNGCPERAPVAPPAPVDTDRDKDGVPNDVDACPDEAGKPDPDPKKNGCPKAFLSGGTITITDQVKFKTGSAEIAPGKDSDEVLGAVLAVLKAHPEIAKVRVEGHTDDRGDAGNNKRLSLARAEAVAKWLADHGIDKQRLAASGFGSEKPIDKNDTEQGRTNNRRVEFHVEQGSAK